MLFKSSLAQIKIIWPRLTEKLSKKMELDNHHKMSCKSFYLFYPHHVLLISSGACDSFMSFWGLLQGLTCCIPAPWSSSWDRSPILLIAQSCNKEWKYFKDPIFEMAFRMAQYKLTSCQNYPWNSPGAVVLSSFFVHQAGDFRLKGLQKCPPIALLLKNGP